MVKKKAKEMSSAWQIILLFYLSVSEQLVYILGLAQTVRLTALIETKIADVKLPLDTERRWFRSGSNRTVLHKKA